MGEPTTSAATVRARWVDAISCVEVRHSRPERKSAYLRLDLEEARRLRDELDAVIAGLEPIYAPVDLVRWRWTGKRWETAEDVRLSTGDVLEPPPFGEHAVGEIVATEVRRAL